MDVWHTNTVPTLLVAAAGGHLEELWQLRPRLAPLDQEVVWVTTDTSHSRSLLAGEQRLFAPPARPRDAVATATLLRLAHHVLAIARWTDVVSTGSLIAVPFLTAARARGTRCHFVESAARVSGPSLSARIVERVPGVQCYSPYERWHRPQWVYRGSVLDAFEAAPPVGPTLRRVVVTLGTSGFDFGRLVRRLSAALPSDCEVLWQTGASVVTDRSVEARPFVAEDELESAIGEADLVISHAGVGSALLALRSGRAPLLVPRRSAHGEHVDDHQVQIAAELARRRLATTCDVNDLSPTVLSWAATRRVAVRDGAPPYLLESRRPTSGRTLAGHLVPVGRRATA